MEWPHYCRFMRVTVLTMTLIIEHLKDRFNALLQEDLATRDRPTSFRILVGTLVILNVFLIIFCLLN